MQICLRISIWGVHVQCLRIRDPHSQLIINSLWLFFVSARITAIRTSKPVPRTCRALTSVRPPAAHHWPPIEEATRTRVRKRYAHVKPEAEFTLPWVHNTLGDATPTVILESAVEGNQVRLDLLLRQDGVNNAKRITLRLKGRTTPAPIVRPKSLDPSTPIAIQIPTTKRDLPPVIYGVAGVMGGGLIGVFIAFLLYG